MNFVIIGAQKAATTWLTYSLKNHKKIYLPKYEIPIFENGYNDDDYYSAIENMYEREGAGKIKGIKNTHLMFHEECSKLLKDRLPDIKIIAALRNPVERAMSSYFWHLRIGALPLLEINNGINIILKLGKNSRDWQTIFEPGFYAKHIKRYYRFFKYEQFHFVLHEEIKTDPNNTLSNLLGFLGVGSEMIDIEKISERSKPKKSIYPLSRIGWLRLRNSIVLHKTKDGSRILWKNINDQGLFQKFVNAFVVGTDRVVWSRVIGNKKPKLIDEVREGIARLYVDDVGELEGLIGKQIPKW